MFRQKRSLAYCEGTWIAYVPSLTVHNWPVRAFCGFPPSAGGLNRGSAHSPVHVGGSDGSVWALSRLSLYTTIVR